VEEVEEEEVLKQPMPKRKATVLVGKSSLSASTDTNTSSFCLTADSNSEGMWLSY
jgi:hypothetical protein